MPVIPPTQEAAIRRIMVQRQSGQRENTLAGRVAQEVEHLPSKYEAQSTTPSTTKR
jgi:hypothetical protein